MADNESHITNDGEEETQEPEKPLTVVVKRTILKQAQHRDFFEAPLDEGLSSESLAQLQERIGEHRKYSGPTFEDVAVPADQELDGESDDVEPTEVEISEEDI